MTEENKRRWDVRLGIAGPIVTVAGLLLGVWQFNRGEENKTKLEYNLLSKKDDLEFQRKLWIDQVATYRSVADIAGKIAAHEKKDARFDDLVESFSGAYWGSMILVEDEAVANAMIMFHDEILDFRAGRSDATRVKQRADILIQTCRHSMETKPEAKQ
jgi:hypothetical protein